MKTDMKNIFGDMRKHLMNGVSYMLPFVVGGGVLMALAILFSGEGAVPETGFLSTLWKIGVAALGLMVPVLSGFIAFSIADRAGLGPGFAGGVIANEIGAGFLGGLIAGILAGIVCYYLKKIKLPISLKALGSIVIVPIFGTLIVGLVLYYVIGTPIAALMLGLTDFLNNMSQGSSLVLGLIIGAMLAFDMGGPLNKVAFSLMVGTVGDGIYTIAGPGAIGIAIPPIAMGLATLISKKKFTHDEREAGKSALVMGAMGITEGAIPFAAADPLRVIPSIMVGGAVGTAMAFVLGVTNKAAWGGLIVLPLVGNPIGFILSLTVGSLVGAIMVITLKKEVKEDTLEDKSSEDEDIDMEMNF